MGSFNIFIIRFVLALIFGVLIGRFFFQKAGFLTLFAFAMVLLGLSYLFEYTKRRDRGKKDGQ